MRERGFRGEGKINKGGLIFLQFQKAQGTNRKKEQI
jgi:hypothetical protein